jgi:hypothetical protein
LFCRVGTASLSEVSALSQSDFCFASASAIQMA